MKRDCSERCKPEAKSQVGNRQKAYRVVSSTCLKKKVMYIYVKRSLYLSLPSFLKLSLNKHKLVPIVTLLKRALIKNNDEALASIN